MWMTMVAVLILIASVSAAAGETGRRYYTEARLRTMRENLKKYDWARKQRDDVIARADRWASHDDERLRTLVIPPQVPRCYDLHNHGCPVHGTEIYTKGLYSWIIDFDRPFKVKCPIGGEEYPSNDFAAFLASGMKDRSLLTGPYADDGWGWHRPGDPTPANYWFVAYYAQWGMMRFLQEAITSLSTAALLTEDPARARVYAHKCAALLWQLAEHYPDYDYATQSREGKEHNPDYHGKLYNHIWEVSTPNDCAPAYDAIRPFLADDPDLRKLAGKSGAEIDKEIRDRLLMEAARCVTSANGRIHGNYGRHQRALLTVALVLSSVRAKDLDINAGGIQHPTSEEMIRFVVENPKPASSLDMGLRDALVNLVYRDGVPPESLNYNLGWNQELTDVAEMLVECGVDVFKEPRFRKLLNWPFDVYVAGKFTPSLGDTGNMFARGGQWTPELYRIALRHVPDARYAWVLKQSPNSGGDIFSTATDDLLAKFVSKLLPEIGLKSFCFPAYGLANLQCGSEANRVASSLSFSSHPSHRHADQLNLALFAHDNALLTDIGYPEQTDAFNYRLYGYFINTIAHNTVTVDAAMQGRGPGVLHALSMRGFAQVVDASCEGAYPGKASLYRRANMLVQVTPEQSYLFDAFYVRGGSQHDYALHGTQADFSCEPALGPVRQEGTLAGNDVPYERFYDDDKLKDKPLGSVSYTGYRGSGYQFLTNLQRAPLQGAALCEWRLTEPLAGQPERPWKGIGLRAHLLGHDEELIACDGPVQRYAYLPKSVKCLIRRRPPFAGGDGGGVSSCFTTVFEPYKGKPWVKRVMPVRIEPDDGQATAALIELTNGSQHYCFHSLAPERTYVLDGRVTVCGQAACLVLDAGAKPVKAMLLNGTRLAIGDYSVAAKGIRRSKIASIDYARAVIELADPIIGKDLESDTSVLVRGIGFADSVTPKKILDKSRFSIGDEDLRVAGGPVVEVRDREIVTSVRTPNAMPGMTLLNSRLEPLGRLKERSPSGWFIDRETPLKPGDFPQAPGDSGPRFYVVMAGPGDEVVVPDCVIRE